MSAARTSFVFYSDWWEHIEMLPDGEALSVIRAIFCYQRNEAVPSLAGAAAMAFSFIRAQLDRDAEKWEQVRQERAEAGKKGGLKTQQNIRELKQTEANAILLEQTEANQAVPVPVPVPVPVYSLSSELSQGSSTDKPKQKKVFEKDGYPYRAARWLADAIEERMPTCKAYTEDTLQSWAADFDKCNRIDGHPWEEMSNVLAFSQEDGFWQQNVLSGSKFRKQYITLLARMNGGKA